ncbi:MAG: alkaline phosphatase PhoX [Salibacteraceae bacterium]
MKKLITLSLACAAAGLAHAQSPFPTLLGDFYNSGAHPSDAKTVVLPPSPIKYEALFVGGIDTVENKSGQKALAKEWQDFTGYVPINGRSDSGYVIVNHERVMNDPINGDGGGMTVFTAHYDQATQSWKVSNHPNGKFRNVDFTGVGGTAANCGGIQTSWGKVFTAEEWGSAFSSNAVIAAQGLTDTSDYTVTNFNGSSISTAIPRHMNYQYMVEVDVAKAEAVRKNYNMGRYDHEGGWIASDRKTVYLTDDKSSGAVLFKFVADKPEDFSKGKLYCYQQSADAMSGKWLPIPMNLNSMMNARDEAFALGATIFMRLEWIEGISDNTIFITETGRGKAQSVAGAVDKGGIMASHLITLDAKDGNLDTNFTDMWGRVLRLDVPTGKIETAIEGGGVLTGDYTPHGSHLSSPDGLASTTINGRTYLAINEDMNPSGMPANPAHFTTKMNEIYMINVTDDMVGKQYKSSDLKRFAVGPKGCETTGGRFTPDGTTYFVNIQHPSADNTYPFNHSVTLAVTGYQTIFSQAQIIPNNSTGVSEKIAEIKFSLYPNPATREITLNRVTDVAIYSTNGQRVKVARNTNVVDVSDLNAGTYVILDKSGENQRLIVQ